MSRFDNIAKHTNTDTRDGEALFTVLIALGRTLEAIEAKMPSQRERVTTALMSGDWANPSVANSSPDDMAACALIVIDALDALNTTKRTK